MLKISKLAIKDYCYEWHISGCLILGLATALGPIMVLFGLKFGIVGSMLDSLIADPQNRAIRPVNSGNYSSLWFSTLGDRSDVAFVIPRTRNIAATIQIKSKTSPRILHIELLPTAKGDPLLPINSIDEDSYSDLILSKSAAKKLAVKPGDTVDGSIARQFNGLNERVHIKLKISAISPPGAFSRDGAFCSLRLLEALENYRDGQAVPDLGWPGDRPTMRQYYPGFRLFAQSIQDVANLQNWLLDQGIEVRTREHDIDTVQHLDQSLTKIYWAIAIVGIIGCALSLGANFWANIDRKRKQLSVLRLVGFNTIDIIWFPVMQSLLTALLGWLLAICMFHLTTLGINQLLVAQLEPGQQTCRLLPVHYMLSFALTCASLAIVASFAGLKASRIEPSEGLRER